MTRRERRMREQESAAVTNESAATSASVPTAPKAATAAADDFAAAAAALNFTGASAKVHSAPEPEASRASSRQETRRVSKPQRTLNTPFRKFAAATGSVAAIGAIALLAAGVSLPLAAPSAIPTVVADAAGGVAKTPVAADPAEAELQGYVAGDDIETAPLERVEGYEASTYSEVAAVSGISTSGAIFDNDPSADIQWPFAVGTSISSPFGYRWGRLHEGVDFTPGDGAPIQAIADGVVRTASEAGGAYGVNVYIDHVIDGELVTSHYAHMQYGSLEVVSGQRVEVGDTLGKTGNTGRSYGSHLHFEIRYNDTAIDPLPWLREHANRHYSDDEKAALAGLEADMLGQGTAE